jgi:SM-20-related protein
VYLNPDWQRSHGGELHIDARSGKSYAVEPILDRVVFFDSVLEHEVCPAFRPRIAVTGWFYGPDPVMDAIRLLK